MTCQSHCWHEPDGASWVRHSGRPKRTVSVTCCDCGDKAIVPMHAQHAVRPLMASRKTHGKYRPDPQPQSAA